MASLTNDEQKAYSIGVLRKILKFLESQSASPERQNKVVTEIRDKNLDGILTKEESNSE